MYMTIGQLDIDVVMEEMKRVRTFVLSIAGKAGLGERQTQELHLVVEEAVANVVNYSGATTMSLCAWQENDSLYVSVTDDGVPFDPTQYPPPNLNVPGEERQAGGLGIHYIRSMSDGVTYCRNDNRNVLTIHKKIK